jgi:hypothetical protein
MDPLRLIALPILIWYPTITIVVYLFYVLLELIPYIKLQRKEPLWVIFITPIYGLFNFLARITGSLVFLYRRTAVFLAKKPRLDDYRTVSLGYRLASLIISCFVFAYIIILITYAVKPIVGSTLFQTLLTLSFIL